MAAGFADSPRSAARWVILLLFGSDCFQLEKQQGVGGREASTGIPEKIPPKDSGS